MHSKIEKNKINVQIKKIEHGIANICTVKSKKNNINVQIKKIEHGIANICTQETEVSVYSHLKSLNTKKTMIYGIGYSGLCFGSVTKMWQGKTGYWDSLPPLDNWTSNVNINKMIKNLHRFAFTQKVSFLFSMDKRY